MSRWRAQSFGNSTTGKAGIVPDAVKTFMGIQNITNKLPSPMKTNLDFISSPKKPSPLDLFESEQAGKPALKKDDKKSQVPKTLLLAAPGSSIVPITNSLVEAIKATNAKAIPGNTVQAIEKKPVLNGAELAAESFMASLANPLFQQMPVDKSLTAALKSMGSMNNPVEAQPSQQQLLANLQKTKRSIDEAHPAKRYAKRLMEHLRRRRNDNNGSMTKPVERSSMMAPINSLHEGPKLMDKIRDMGRVIATP